MLTYRQKTALITGASSGIGASFARELAHRGMNLILVARSESKLQTLATELSRHDCRIEVVVCDLSQPGAAQHIYNVIQHRQLQVDLLINNAGFGTYGLFEQLEPEREQEEIRLNVAAVVDLSRAFIPDMLKQGSGAIINVASTAGHQPVPYMAVYGATKAFVLSFSEALWAEYRDRGIRVLALCPGPTETPFHAIAQERQVGQMTSPETVVSVGLKALEQGRSYVIPGRMNAFLSVLLPRLLPRALVALIAKQMTQPIPNSSVQLQEP
ncbi:MAG TPA: oxidoreductase [Cyanobacteria bacterium UBA12227]|nr:oxidoreductase [Cyanobacteria bacterium UBA12227]HAX84995.1 oxidoreductase [Cyanobacteria bacterium UBA11370]HBY80938.1 oxidoreductase [Cyanobacteria bacterium UBA11148]